MKNRGNEKDDSEFSKIMEIQGKIIDNFKNYASGEEMYNDMVNAFTQFGWTKKEFNNYKSQLKR